MVFRISESSTVAPQQSPSNQEGNLTILNCRKGLRIAVSRKRGVIEKSTATQSIHGTGKSTYRNAIKSTMANVVANVGKYTVRPMGWYG